MSQWLVRFLLEHSTQLEEADNAEAADVVYQDFQNDGQHDLLLRRYDYSTDALSALLSAADPMEFGWGAE